jgi:hypothetical protein
MDKSFLKGRKQVEIERKNGRQLTVRVEPELGGTGEISPDGAITFKLSRENYGMFELFHVKVPGYQAPEPMPMGKLLFDTEGNWIYDGEALTVGEQEQIAGQITGHHGEMERLLSSIT